MNPRSLQPSSRAEGSSHELTPKLRRDMAARALLKAIDDYVGMILETHQVRDEWVDQNGSPLGKFAHMHAVKQGRLPGVKHGKLILVRRTDLNSYLAKHSVKHRSTAETAGESVDESRAEEVAAQVLTHVGLRQRKG